MSPASAGRLPVTTLEALADHLAGETPVEAARAFGQDLLAAGWIGPSVAELAALGDDAGEDTVIELRAAALAEVGIDPAGGASLPPLLKAMLVEAIADGRLDSRQGLRLGARLDAVFDDDHPGLFDAFVALADQAEAGSDPELARLGHQAWTAARLRAAEAGGPAPATPDPAWKRLYAAALAAAALGFLLWKLYGAFAS